MTQREAGRGWEVESGGGGIKFAPDFYTGTIGGNAKQPLARGFRLDGAEREGVRLARLLLKFGSRLWVQSHDASSALTMGAAPKRGEKLRTGAIWH